MIPIRRTRSFGLLKGLFFRSCFYVFIVLLPISIGLIWIIVLKLIKGKSNCMGEI